MSDVFSVIMAGGSGTRFWPLSRQARPKQFLPLTSRKALIVETFERMRGLSTPKQTFVVCGKRHAPSVKKLLRGMPVKNVLVEPEARNTAPAIALAAAHVAHLDPQGVLVVLPSDQHVADVAAFHQALQTAIEVAKGGAIVTLGIAPTRPETGYGYIRLGAAQGKARKVAAFVEKPNAATAEQYLASKDYLWNAGIFVFRADVMLSAFDELMPELARPLSVIRASLGTRRAAQVLAREFKNMPATSIDYGIAEKARNVTVVPCDCGWSDVGSFGALHEVRPTDPSGNVVSGADAFVVDTKNSVVLAHAGRPLAVVGMSDVVVVDAGDAVLVLPKSRSQDVRLVIEALKRSPKHRGFL